MTSKNAFNILAISPIDGRYANKTKVLQAYFSEYALIKYRIKIEVLYLLELSKQGLFTISENQKEKLLGLLQLTPESELIYFQQIKDIESITKHDVKAVEYFLQDFVQKNDMCNLENWIHFGLTSQDINNTAIPCMLKNFYQDHFINAWEMMINTINQLALLYKDIPMLSRTHGQPATPTILGKEFKVFSERLKAQLHLLKLLPHRAKFGGAIGNLNAHKVSLPAIDWQIFADHFVKTILGLERTEYTTQIEPYDFLAAHCDTIKRMNTILIDFCRDIWAYISMNYFIQKINSNEVGSSAMPHKVNPIDFENAEGNLMLANAGLAFLSEKLPISRLQRDLTDSTVLRNLGVPLAHTWIALESIQNGLKKLVVNEETLKHDLEDNWVVVAEAIQNVLRTEGFEKPYQLLKDFSRQYQKITKKEMDLFIQQLNVPDNLKQKLLRITPFNYTGYGL